MGYSLNRNPLIKTVGRLGIEPRTYFRPAEVDTLIGNSSKAQNILNWQAKTTYKELVHLMVESDLKVSGLDPKKFLKPCAIDS